MTSYGKYLKTKLISWLTWPMGAAMTAAGIYGLGLYPEAPIALAVGIILIVLNPVLYFKLRADERKEQ